MTSGGGFIDFFVLEANEYIEQLDGLMLRARGSAPDGETLQRTGRALRGAATMAKLTAFADLAGAMEGIGRASRDGVIEWTAALRAAMISAVDDCKILVRGARNWGEAEVRRAEARTRELASFAPAPHRSTAVAAAVVSPTYLVGEANNIAAGLELLVTRPDNQAGAGPVLNRVRALRGVAGIKDLPPLAEVAEAAENAARPLELGESRLSIERVELLRASAVLLRRIAMALRDGQPTSEASSEYEQFVAASERLESTGDSRIVPIASLFYNDAGPHIVACAPNPPTTPHQRFRMEAVSLAEHLKGLVAAVRTTTDPHERERARRGLRRALRNIGQAAESFGEDDVTRLIASHGNAADTVDDASLATIERIVQTIAYPDAPVSASAPTPITQRLAIPASARAPAPIRPTPVRLTPAFSTPAVAVATSLDEGIASLDALASRPFAEPAPIDDFIVPIDALVYRGRAAIERAVEIRDQMRQAGGTPAPELLTELFDLLDLALVD